jgi:glycosyltransferase involved in cell wall biosynthesis
MVTFQIAQNKIKIFMISDHQLSTSGVGVQSRYLIQGLIATGRYKFVCYGGALRHDSMDLVKVNDDFIIKPTNGFGTTNEIRQVLAIEKPDMMLLFTDPRFFGHVFAMEDEIHQICPIAYWTIWDAPPTPKFNNVIYESCDLLNTINYPTYEFLQELGHGTRSNYVPHAVPSEVFFPLPDEERMKWKRKLLGDARMDHMIVLFVSRNARRKVPSDIIKAFGMFLDELEKKHGHRKATLVAHTDPTDVEGPNLHRVVELCKLQDNVTFSKDRVGFGEMNVVYNISDFVVNASLAEGFGLSLLESKMCARPVVAQCTGGMTRQVRDHITGEEYGVAMDPDVTVLVGNQQVPYINEDLVRHETIASAYMKMYEMGPEGRKDVGQRALTHAKRDYDINNMISTWDTSIQDTLTKWREKRLPNNRRWSQQLL